MGIIVNQSVKGTIYVYLGVILGFITTGIFLPRLFSTDEVGLLKILVAYSSLIASFGTLGINGVTFRLFPFFKDDTTKNHGYLANILLVGLAGFLLTTILLILLKPWLTEINIEKSALFVEHINYLIILIFFQIFFSILDAYYSALMNSVHGTFLKEVFQRILIIISIGLFFFDFLTFHQFVIMYVASISLPTLNLVITLIRKKHFSLHTDFTFLTRSMLVSVGAVSLFSILNGFSMIIIQNVDIIMINSMVGLSDTGIYSICFFFGVVVSLPARSIIKIANIITSQAWKDNDLKLIKDLYHKSCLTLFIIGLLLFIGLWANIDNIFHIIGLQYSAGKWVIFFIGLSSLIDMITGANGAIIGTSKYYKVQTVFLVILVILLVITNLLLIPRFGITGAAIGSAISLSVLNLLRYLFLLYKYQLQPFNIQFVYVALIGAGSYLISMLLPSLSNYIVDIFVRSTILVILFCTPIYILRISSDINAKADEILKKLKIIK